MELSTESVQDLHHLRVVLGTRDQQVVNMGVDEAPELSLEDQSVASLFKKAFLEAELPERLT